MTGVTIVCVESPELRLGALLESAAAEHHTFVKRTSDEWQSGANRFDRDGEAFFLATVDGEPVGMCGLNVDPFTPDPAVGRIRHLYVAPGHRRQGVGSRLVASCLELAIGRFHRVRLRTFDPDAGAFYERMGFSRTTEADATHAKQVLD